MSAPSPCPCRPAGGPPYADCCGRYHAGALHLLAPTAEALMRSRYSAYVRHLPDYLLATWHPTTRPSAIDPDPPGWRWIGLDVKRHTVHDPDHATVEFVARRKLAGKAERLREISRFVCEDGRWLYVGAT